VPIETFSTLHNIHSLLRKVRSFALRATVFCGLVCGATAIHAQATSFGNGYSAAAEARGGTLAAQQGDPLDAIEGNPASRGHQDARSRGDGSRRLRIGIFSEFSEQ
jgi:hypothetical protein